MSVLIHDMEMPQSCDDCRLNNGVSCYAVPEYTEDGVVGRTDDRPDWCPLIFIPPHGDLIDRDPFIKFIKTHWDSYDQWFVDQLEARPTVITADTAEEGE